MTVQQLRSSLYTIITFYLEIFSNAEKQCGLNLRRGENEELNSKQIHSTQNEYFRWKHLELQKSALMNKTSHNK